MQLRYLTLMLVALLAVHFGVPLEWQRQYAGELRGLIERGLHSALYTRSVHIAGNSLIREETLRALLPEQDSNLSWSLESSAVRAALEQHPLVAQAEVQRCGFFSWGCFSVKLTERAISYGLLEGERVMLTGADGYPVGTVTAGALRQSGVRFEGLELQMPRIVRGVLPATSPDHARGAVRWIDARVSQIEQVLGVRINAVEVQAGEVLAVRVQGLDGEFRFVDPSAAEDPSIQQQARRLRAILEELEGRAFEVREIDLGLRRQAVIRF